MTLIISSDPKTLKGRYIYDSNMRYVGKMNIKDTLVAKRIKNKYHASYNTRLAFRFLAKLIKNNTNITNPKNCIMYNTKICTPNTIGGYRKKNGHRVSVFSVKIWLLTLNAHKTHGVYKLYKLHNLYKLYKLHKLYK